ncbi:MAG: hypothetical protein H6671_18030 [Anaerolineaceae bacterium]|nr:hypothetical protein [Anaerolineaceae bacterium]
MMRLKVALLAGVIIVFVLGLAIVIFQIARIFYLQYPGLSDKYEVRYLANDIYCYERKKGYE